MKIVILLVSAACFILAVKKNRSISNPYVAFNALWMGVAALINIGNKFVYEPSNTALICVLVGILGFNISSITPRLVIGRKTKTLMTEKEYTLNYRTAHVISIIVLALSAVTAASAIRSFLTGASFASIREDYYTYSTNENVLLYYLRNFILSPLRYVVVVTTIIALFKKVKVSKWLIINTIGIIVLQAITSGGRYVLMNTIFMLLCGFSLFVNKEKISIKQKIIMAIIIGLFSYIIVFLTNDRSTYLSQAMTVGERLYQTIYIYFAGSTTYMGEVIAKTPTIMGSTFGINFFAGFLIPLFVVLNYIHLIPYPKVFSVIGTYACEVLRIGPATYYNAMPTIFGYFYIDGGLALVFIEAWLFGYICKRVFLKAEHGNYLYISLFMLLFVQICTSSTRWFLYSPDFCLAMIYMRMIIRKVSMGGVLLGLILSSICRWCFSSRKKEYVRSHMYSTWLVGGAVQ